MNIQLNVDSKCNYNNNNKTLTGAKNLYNNISKER